MAFWDNIFKKEERKEITELEERNVNMAQYSNEASFTINTDVVSVDEDSIQTIPTVVSCLELITGTIAQLPIYLYKENKDGTIEKINNDKRLFHLNNEANENMTAFNYKKTLTKDFLLHGSAYTYIEKNGNDVTGLYSLPSKNVDVRKLIHPLGYKYEKEISYNSEAGTSIFKPYDIMTILKDTNDGAESQGVLKRGKKIFELALNENEYSATILNKGALPIGILETEGRLTKETASKLRQGWERLYTGMKNAGKTVVLEEGLKYKPLSLSPNDLNLNDSKKMSSEEICKLFNVPPSLVLGNSSYGNIEQDNLHFSKYCLSSIVTSIESELDRSLLLEEEKENGYYFRFALDEILRSTEVEKYSAIEKGMKSGVLSINESRAKLDLPPLEQDYIMFSLGNVFYDKDKKEFIVPNMGQTMGEETDNVTKQKSLNGTDEKKEKDKKTVKKE